MNTYFVGGSPRSGTTLLQSILCSDVRTNPLIRETHYLYKIVETYRHTVDSFDALESCHYFSSVEEVREVTRPWAEAFLSHVRARYSPASSLVLKYVGLTQLYPALAELLPDARLILIVRDPKDTIGSLIEVGKKSAEQGKRNNFPSVTDKLISFYRSFYEPSLSCRESSFRARLHLVRYEDLVRDPASEIARLEDFTGLSLRGFNPDGEWSRQQVDFAKDRGNNNPWITELNGGAVSESRLGRYREVMSEAEAAGIERACAHIMDAFGYRSSAERTTGQPEPKLETCETKSFRTSADNSCT